MKELTFGQIEVGLDFNPSGDPDVIKVKQMYADIVDHLNDLRNRTISQNQKRWCSVGITEAVMAQMAAVKAITWKDPVFDFDGIVVELSQSVPVIVDFYSDTCAPCKAILPELEKLAKEKGIELVKINTMLHQDLANRFKIRGVPHVMLYHKGVVISERSGYGEDTMKRLAIEVDRCVE